VHITIGDYIVECAANAVEAGAGTVVIQVNQQANRLMVSVADNGPGMDEQTLARITDPYATDGVKHPGRKVGLGLAFLKQALEATGGEFDIKSELGLGTSVEFGFDLNHIDTPPLGDMVSIGLSVVTLAGAQEVSVVRIKEGSRYRISREELVEALEDLESAESLVLARSFIQSQEENLT
jgi:hypothetical protein